MKIGVYAGSFNPVHIGHKAIIDELFKDKIIDKIIIIPLNGYWDKLIDVSLKDRVNMLKINIQNNVEIYSEFANLYAYDILEKLKDLYPGKLYYIIGSDNLLEIKKWKNYKKLLNQKFIVINRNGYNIEKLIKISGLENNKIIRINDFGYNISSTKIREKIKNNENIEGLVDDKVKQYIRKHQLYR